MNWCTDISNNSYEQKWLWGNWALDTETREVTRYTLSHMSKVLRCYSCASFTHHRKLCITALWGSCWALGTNFFFRSLCILSFFQCTIPPYQVQSWCKQCSIVRVCAIVCWWRFRVAYQERNMWLREHFHLCCTDTFSAVEQFHDTFRLLECAYVNRCLRMSRIPQTSREGTTYIIGNKIAPDRSAEGPHFEITAHI